MALRPAGVRKIAHGLRIIAQRLLVAPGGKGRLHIAEDQFVIGLDEMAGRHARNDLGEQVGFYICGAIRWLQAV